MGIGRSNCDKEDLTEFDVGRKTYTSHGGIEPHDDTSGFLRPSSDIENIWAYDANGEHWNARSISKSDL